MVCMLFAGCGTPRPFAIAVVVVVVMVVVEGPLRSLSFVRPVACCCAPPHPIWFLE